MIKGNDTSPDHTSLVNNIFKPFSDAKIAVACIQRNGDFLLVNRTFADTLGYDSQHLSGESFLLLCEKKLHKCTLTRLAALFDEQIDNYKLKRNLLKKDNAFFTASVSVSAIKDDANKTIAAIIIVSEISDSIDQLLEIKKLSYAVENSGSAVMITDANGAIEYANARLSDITGYPLDELLGNTPAILRSGQTSDETYKNLWSCILANKPWRGSLINRKKNGSFYWAYQSIAPIIDKSGSLISIVSVSDDISQIKEHEGQMEQLAFFDPLTTLGNRRKFRDELNRLIATPETLSSALFLLDLDHFKQVNDTLGHDAGDQLLIAVANRLRFCSNEHYTAFRLGGDEFTLLVTQVKNPSTLEHLAAEVIELLAQPLQVGSHEITITVSLGITLIHTDGDEASDLLRNADLAMYEAKRIGRNTFAFFKPHMDFESKRALSLELDLRHAIEHEELSLVFQPLIDLRTGRITGLEALTRWHHPIEGDIPTTEFIKRAEETGLIIPLGKWVLRKSAMLMTQLHLAGYPYLSLSINISHLQLKGFSLITTLHDVLHEMPFLAEKLTLDISGSLSLHNTSQIVDAMQQIKGMGVGLALDDFGTDFVSLELLQKMPIDYLKVDLSFIQKLPNDHDSAVITSTAIMMAKKLGITAHAEGIASQEQQQFLLSHHCFSGQGNLYSAPLPIDELLCALDENTGVFTDKQIFVPDDKHLQ
ncbi:EAL domain-containing protein [Neptunomonas japonica]|uniref:EAL domain-containing protein n=1 Tax=Neptunomonas japonica TaxID=417574 RepID=UPI0003FA2208|nr:EAL domain-containing protein [Neptunomonas japonica]